MPDLAGWRRTRMPELPDATAFELAPDWVCEVVSAGTVASDRADKLPIYAGAGLDGGRGEREALSDVRVARPAGDALEDVDAVLGHLAVAKELARLPPFDLEMDIRRMWTSPNP